MGLILQSGEISKDKINLVAGAITQPFAEMVWVTMGGKWKPTRIEMNMAQEWYLVGIRADDLNGLRVRI